MNSNVPCKKNDLVGQRHVQKRCVALFIAVTESSTLCRITLVYRICSHSTALHIEVECTSDNTHQCGKLTATVESFHYSWKSSFFSIPLYHKHCSAYMYLHLRTKKLQNPILLNIIQKKDDSNINQKLAI